MTSARHNSADNIPPVRVVAWELTRACNLTCPYCRASAGVADPGELDTAAVLAAVDELARLGRPLVILSGGEPLLREDLFRIIAKSVEAGFPTAVATNGTLITHEVAGRLATGGVRRVSVSLDFPDERRHDAVRGRGSFAAAIDGMAHLREAGVPFQVNMTVSAANRDDIAGLLAFARDSGAVELHLFFIVNVGRAAGSREGLAPTDYEEVLEATARLEASSAIPIRVTCAPQYSRVREQTGLASAGHSVARSCMAGRGFLFLSATGEIKPCGYFDRVVAKLGRAPLDKIWRENGILNALRNTATFSGRCGICDYREICGGCRARALAETGDFLSEDPACVYNL